MPRRPIRFAALGLAIGAALLAATAGGDDPGGQAPAAPKLAANGSASPALRARLVRLERQPPSGRAPNGVVTVGHSALGRPIQLKEYGFDDSGRRVLVFGCIHGTECAASGMRSFLAGCPTPGAVFYVPNLNPDGLALQSRLNGRGVDLNRNFPSEWRLSGRRWDLEYSGARPFSEPETRLARDLIEAVHPDVTIWFHQEAEPMVRAWGSSVPAARRYARYSGLPFRHLPWLAGTAPNWQNHTFSGTASFVVELPLGALSTRRADRYGYATARLSF